jgi:hypothetical protein
VKPLPLDPALQAKLAGWLEANGKLPLDYIVSLFADHDTVMLGEQHRVKHDPLFVQSLIAPLYEKGVRNLAFEFGRREDQPLVDILLNAKEWNEELARKIVLNWSVSWGYREYVDVYKAAWRLNSSLPEGAPRFRILALNDSPDWSLIKSKEDMYKPEVMERVWNVMDEDNWAKVVLDVLRTGEKVLSYSGIHHAFTAYRQPMVEKGKFRGFSDKKRYGNYVYAELGKRAITVFLHAPWNGKDGYESPLGHPANGIIDALMLSIGPHPAGFDITNGPFGELDMEDTLYSHGYDNFTLAGFCDGWIYTKPISKYEGVSAIGGWINKDNETQARAEIQNPYYRNASIDTLNDIIAGDADIHKYWAYLQ